MCIRSGCQSRQVDNRVHSPSMRGMDAKLRQQWAQFLNGHWTLSRPTKPGLYRIVSRIDTDTQSFGHEAVVFWDPNVGEARAVTPWGGYWWSEPTPPLPSVEESRREQADAG